jgi:hypothetical protein
MRRRANRRQSRGRRHFRPCRLLASRPRDLRLQDNPREAISGERQASRLPTSSRRSLLGRLLRGSSTNLQLEAVAADVANCLKRELAKLISRPKCRHQNG